MVGSNQFSTGFAKRRVEFALTKVVLCSLCLLSRLQYTHPIIACAYAILHLLMQHSFNTLPKQT